MQIYGPFRIQTAASVQGTNRITGKSPESVPDARGAGSVDQLDISSAAREALAAGEASVGGSEGLRWEKINQLRQQIADGTYETPERMDAALNRLLDQIG